MLNHDLRFFITDIQKYLKYKSINKILEIQKIK